MNEKRRGNVVPFLVYTEYKLLDTFTEKILEQAIRQETKTQIAHKIKKKLLNCNTVLANARLGR